MYTIVAQLQHSGERPSTYKEHSPFLRISNETHELGDMQVTVRTEFSTLGDQEIQRWDHPQIQELLLSGLPLILGESTCPATNSQALAGSTEESKTCCLFLLLRKNKVLVMVWG